MQQHFQQPHAFNMVGNPVATVIYTTRPRDYMIPSILSCLLCFCPTGILAILYSVKSKHAADRNDFALAQKEGSMAKICAAISFGIGLAIFLSGVIYIIVVFAIFANFANSLLSG